MIPLVTGASAISCDFIFGPPTSVPLLSWSVCLLFDLETDSSVLAACEGDVHWSSDICSAVLSDDLCNGGLGWFGAPLLWMLWLGKLVDAVGSCPGGALYSAESGSRSLLAKGEPDGMDSAVVGGTCPADALYSVESGSGNLLAKGEPDAMESAVVNTSGIDCNQWITKYVEQAFCKYCIPIKVVDNFNKFSKYTYIKSKIFYMRIFFYLFLTKI